MLDTQGIESRRPGFELFSTSAAKGDVVESDSKFIEHIALKLMLISWIANIGSNHIAARQLSASFTATCGDSKRRIPALNSCLGYLALVLAVPEGSSAKGRLFGTRAILHLGATK